MNRVSRLGPEALNDLSPKAKIWLAPLPYLPPSPAYRKKLENLREKGIMSHTKKENSADGKTGLSEAEEKMLSKIRSETAYIAEAQSLWDATMACIYCGSPVFMGCDNGFFHHRGIESQSRIIGSQY